MRNFYNFFQAQKNRENWEIENKIPDEIISHKQLSVESETLPSNPHIWNWVKGCDAELKLLNFTSHWRISLQPRNTHQLINEFRLSSIFALVYILIFSPPLALSIQWNVC